MRYTYFSLTGVLFARVSQRHDLSDFCHLSRISLSYINNATQMKKNVMEESLVERNVIFVFEQTILEASESRNSVIIKD